ncbi:WbqC family protein [Dechloromonas sp. XY25]|uniref:WbqC family protein n=1 Tax=Dechloromonas hankyongensis TaxID=2908002 RepID=A0ABS9JZC4_9RHOO|nr:WbqC family protein [Dechloromonas hankyongensis]MCG2576267.1 WbqC family protein [Dechloromonas hankyongensis]
MTELVAIHQPNLFPWLGYFDKIHRADVFILLDDVQYPKTGGSWSNRVKVLINGEGRWLTAPVDRSHHGTRAINEMVFCCKEDWRAKVLKTLVAAYRRAPFFENAFAVLEPLVRYPEDNVAEYNVHAIVTLAGALGLPTGSFVRSSSLPTVSTATQRLIDLTRQVGGRSYLCGGGAGGYQEDEAFAAVGLSLVYQCFVPKFYSQHGTTSFVPGLSIIDAAMNLGWHGVGSLLRGGGGLDRKKYASACICSAY